MILTLTRWDPTKPPVMSNLVLMMQKEAQILHEKGQGAFDAATIEKIKARLDWAKAYLEEEESKFSRGLKDGSHHYISSSAASSSSTGYGRYLSLVGGALSVFAAGFVVGMVKR